MVLEMFVKIYGVIGLIVFLAQLAPNVAGCFGGSSGDCNFSIALAGIYLIEGVIWPLFLLFEAIPILLGFGFVGVLVLFALVLFVGSNC